MMIARVLLLPAMLALSAVAVARDVNSYQKLLSRYLCPVVDRLERVYAMGDPAAHSDEYLIVAIDGRDETYVQCLFYRTDESEKIMCEAASGFYLTKPGQRRTVRLAADAIAALARLGFSTDDSQGNFRIDLDADPPDFRAIGELILKALHDAYGARAESKLLLIAPYAPRGAPKCVPVS
jgi:hypothetical protein